jgi:hypothetical protein
VGGRRYPQGVLLRGIYSWVFPQTIYPITPKAPKTDTITGYNKTKQKCDSLNKEIERKHQINAHREDSIVKPARIEAKQIADKRFLNKYRQKYR